MKIYEKTTGRIVDEFAQVCGSKPVASRIIYGTPIIAISLWVLLGFILAGCTSIPNNQIERQQRIVAAESAVNSIYKIYLIALDEQPDPEFTEKVHEWTVRTQQISLAVDAAISSLEALGVNVDYLRSKYRSISPEIMLDTDP